MHKHKTETRTILACVRACVGECELAQFCVHPCLIVTDVKQFRSCDFCWSLFGRGSSHVTFAVVYLEEDQVM